MTKVDLFLRQPRHLRQGGRVHLFSEILLGEGGVPIQELLHIFLLHAHGSVLLLFSPIGSAMEHQRSACKVSQFTP